MPDTQIRTMLLVTNLPIYVFIAQHSCRFSPLQSTTSSYTGDSILDDSSVFSVQLREFSRVFLVKHVENYNPRYLLHDSCAGRCGLRPFDSVRERSICAVDDDTQETSVDRRLRSDEWAKLAWFYIFFYYYYFRV